MIVMIDNYDSFTYNIVSYCNELGYNLKIIRNDELSLEQIKELKPSKLIISPGPATPNEAGVTLEAITYFAHKIPILGICLGHQSIAQAFGAKVVRAKNMMHGKTSNMLQSSSCEIFESIPREFRATRYHSLVVDKDSLPSNIEPTAFSEDDGEIMALKLKDSDVYGVQFHPESIMSEYGHQILKNFLEL